MSQILKGMFCILNMTILRGLPEHMENSIHISISDIQVLITSKRQAAHGIQLQGSCFHQTVDYQVSWKIGGGRTPCNSVEHPLGSPFATATIQKSADTHSIPKILGKHDIF